MNVMALCYQWPQRLPLSRIGWKFMVDTSKIFVQVHTQFCVRQIKAVGQLRAVSKRPYQHSAGQIQQEKTRSQSPVNLARLISCPPNHNPSQGGWHLTITHFRLLLNFLAAVLSNMQCFFQTFLQQFVLRGQKSSKRKVGQKKYEKTFEEGRKQKFMLIFFFN